MCSRSYNIFTKWSAEKLINNDQWHPWVCWSILILISIHIIFDKYLNSHKSAGLNISHETIQEKIHSPAKHPYKVLPFVDILISYRHVPIDWPSLWPCYSPILDYYYYYCWDWSLWLHTMMNSSSSDASCCVALCSCGIGRAFCAAIY